MQYLLNICPGIKSQLPLNTCTVIANHFISHWFPYVSHKEVGLSYNDKRKSYHPCNLGPEIRSNPNTFYT